jgi:HD-GYP domain-containing protein (c-di-GMP phosphodiesterase class II)
MSISSDDPTGLTARCGPLLETFPDLILLLDETGTVLDCKTGSPALLEAHGAPVLRRRLDELLLQESAVRFQRAIHEALKGGTQPSVDYCVQAGDGTRWFEARLVTTSEKQVMAVVRDITRHKQAEEKVQQQLNRLAALHAIDLLIASSFDLNLTLSMLLSHVTAQLKVDAAGILLYNPQSRALEFSAGLGFRTEALQHTHLRLGEGYAGTAALQRKTLHIVSLQHGPTNFVKSKSFQDEAFVSYIGVPLVAKGQVRGVLEIFQRARLDPDDDWLSFLETLAGQASIAIENASLFRELQRSNVELTQAYDATIEGWSRALELRDQITEGHTKRVTDLAMHLARRLDFTEDSLIHIRRGAMLHDIGKMAIPDSILAKPAPLSAEEWAVMRRHPSYAYELLSPIQYLKPALDIPHFHHEKWDGSGYPDGIRQDQIPLPARLFAVIDVFDALTSHRPYRAAWAKEQALTYIREQSEKHFDPRIVNEFLNMSRSLGR